MSGFKVNGVDLDGFFNSGSGGAVTGFRNSGTDLNARYAVYSFGTQATTGFRVAGTDVKTRFQAPFTTLTASLSPTSVAGSRSNAGYCEDTTGPTVCTPSGGTPGYSYLWEFVSGDSAIVANSPTSSSTRFSATLANGETKNAYFRCKVTDSGVPQTAYTGNVYIALVSAYVAPLSASASPTGVDGFRVGAGWCYTGQTTCSASGGTAPYSYDWEYVSGDVASASNDTSATTGFQNVITNGGSETSYMRCKVTDNLGNIAYSNTVTAYFESEYDSGGTPP